MKKRFHPKDESRIARFEIILNTLNNLREPKSVSQLHTIINIYAYNTIRLDCAELVKIGYLHKNSQAKIAVYTALKSQLNLDDYRSMGADSFMIYEVIKEPQPSGSTIVRLTENTYWTARSKAPIEVRRGCSLDN
jgi:hypothetical protein